MWSLLRIKPILGRWSRVGAMAHRRSIRHPDRMARHYWVAAAAFAALSIQTGRAQELSAPEILAKVGETYQNLSSCRFQWTNVSETRIGSTTSTRETRFDVAVLKPNKVRVVIDYPEASDWYRLSDGHTFVQYRASDADASRQPASEYDLRAVRSTRIGSYQDIADGAENSKVVGSETLQIGGAGIDCHIVELQYSGGTLLSGSKRLPTRFWIDKARFLVLREIAGTKSGAGRNATENHRTTTFTLAEVNAPVPDSLFAVGRLKK